MGKEGDEALTTDQRLRRHDAYADAPRRVPIGPLCSRPLDQIDVLALSILPGAEEKHRRVVWSEPCVVSMASNWDEGAMSLPVGGTLRQDSIDYS